MCSPSNALNNVNTRTCTVKGYSGDEVSVQYSENTTVLDVKRFVFDNFLGDSRDNKVHPEHLRLFWFYDGKRGTVLTDNVRISTYDIPDNKTLGVDLAGFALSLKKTSKVTHQSDEDDDESCIVCLDKAREYAPIPCGHAKYCLDCITKINECSECRQKITGKIKIYI